MAHLLSVWKLHLLGLGGSRGCASDRVGDDNERNEKVSWKLLGGWRRVDRGFDFTCDNWLANSPGGVQG